MLCTLKNVHNHSLNSAAALAKAPVHDETKEKLNKLFESGLTAVKAENNICGDICEPEKPANKSLCPDYHFVKRLVLHEVL